MKPRLDSIFLFAALPVLTIVVPAQESPSPAAAAPRAPSPAIPVPDPDELRADPAAEPVPPPTLANGAYGTHPRQVFDLWQAKSDSPTPLVLFIHGGGFTGGSKAALNVHDRKDVNEMLAAGISIAAIEYRVLADAKLPAAHRDVTRAIQFLRSKAKKWNFDKARVGAFGGSAGAQLCAYLGFHDELADPKNADPIARESSRLTCVATAGLQVTLDMKWWLQHVPQYDTAHRSNEEFFGTDDEAAAKKIIAEISALALISADDSPIYMSYNMAPGQPYPNDAQKTRAWKVHHIVHGLALKKRCDELGVEASLKYPGMQSRYPSVAAFFRAKLLPR